MKKILGTSFQILRHNLLFLQPILVYFLLIVIALQYIFFPNIPLYSKGIFVICMFMFTCAMSAGTFYINRKAVIEYSVEDDDEERTRKTIKNFKLFFEGVGDKFFKVLSATVLYCIVYFLIIKLLSILCVHFFGVPSIFSRFDELSKLQTIEQVKAFIASFDENEIYSIRMWTYIFTLAAVILNFFGFLYFAVIVSEKDNFFVCFFKTILFGLKNIITSILIMIFMLILYLITNFLAAIFGSNSIMLAVFIILSVLYLNYYIILVLYFYNERTKTHSDSGPECIREDEISD